MNFRIINDSKHNAFFNMAFDEALMKLFNEKEFDAILRVYGWQPKAVSIGYFQCVNDEVALDECKKKNVDVVRRITGGGAVFHDNELTYSIICNEDFAGKDIIESYKKLCHPIIFALEKLGLKAEFKPINDIIVNGKKISGNAQTRKEQKILQHGTLLLKVNVNEMFSLLKVPNEKLKDKLIKDIKQRITSLEDELQKNVSFEEMKKLFIESFCADFKAKAAFQNATEEELLLAKNIQKERYENTSWLFMR